MEEEILEECNKLFVTMANCHIDGKPMADLLALYNKMKEKNEKIEQILYYKNKMIDGLMLNEEKLKNELVLYKIYTKQNNLEDFDLFMKQTYISKDKIKEKIEEVQARMGNDCVALHDFQREAKIDVLKELLEGK